MTASSIWDNPDMKVGGDWIKFENVGDSMAGNVVAVGIQKWEDGSVSPKITFTTGERDENGDLIEKCFAAGPIRLKAALVEARPEVGDYLTVEFTHIEKRQGGKTLKHFDVNVSKAGGSLTKSAPISTEADSVLDDMDPAVVEALKKKLGATPF
jgi:hypothetical protein